MRMKARVDEHNVIKANAQFLGADAGRVAGSLVSGEALSGCWTFVLRGGAEGRVEGARRSKDGQWAGLQGSGGHDDAGPGHSGRDGCAGRDQGNCQHASGSDQVLAAATMFDDGARVGGGAGRILWLSRCGGFAGRGVPSQRGGLDGADLGAGVYAGTGLVENEPPE